MNNVAVLAVKEVSGRGGFVVRARHYGLIRYFWITHEAAALFPEGWEKEGPLVPPGNYPADMKCIHLRRPEESDDVDPRLAVEYPVMEIVDVKLTGVDVPWDIPVRYDYDNLITLAKVPSQKLKIRPSEDRLRRVRHENALLTEGPEAPSYLLKLSEFPHEWPRPEASLVQRWTPGFVASLVPSLAPPAAPHAVTNEQPSYDGDLAREMRLHRELLRAYAFAGAAPDHVPAIAGVVEERGRGPVGLLTEWVEGDEPHGGAPNFRDILRRLRDRAGPGGRWRLPEADRRACRAALRSLHDLGYVHGAALPQHFLRRRDGRVVLVDFQKADRLNLVTRKGQWDAAVRKIADSQDLERWLDLSEESGRYKRDMALDLLN